MAKREISLFSGIEFNVDKTQGLVGRCDFIVSQSRSQYSLSAPVLALVETKKRSHQCRHWPMMAE
ncbi:MAG: hypothetical protein HC771_23525 [Synechococcales cyanobacterium CRU_2_2]|nr:hypothetical protein [Synechococcales cyanobacterium CRU_2_2]